ncbi:unnamed protein product [Didymodactylos carnosus]|uniref:Helix-turn-helix domain-containing protein n=1 Tax=Didymodactylos carnosus TaxID=1234261 RepID=A0A816EVC8_9BILA|nr:unnamed protein product [Didymodactylos carnosus]CAF4589370.1 unnamed protein product [Didymodactylos carnosus]
MCKKKQKKFTRILHCRTVLQENVFAYGNKIYKQTTGGAISSSFTLTLANIFMWDWQKKLVDEQTKTGEFYGTYIDDIFMTWNKSEKELEDLLNQAIAERCVIPFTSVHPRHVFANIILTSHARAVKYSSTFEEFNYERQFIKLMLLYNM